METSISDKIHEKINGWLNKLDHFQLQLSLGKMEAKDEYTNQKKQLHDYLHQYIQTAENFAHVADDKVESIVRSLTELKNEFQKDEEATEKTIGEHKNSIIKLIEKVAP